MEKKLIQQKKEQIKRNDNLNTGDIGLWYDVIINDNDEIIHCVCPYDKCKNFDDAIDYYFENYHKEHRKPIQVCHNKIDFETVILLSRAA